MNKTINECETKRTANGKEVGSSDWLEDLLEIKSKAIERGKCIRDEEAICCWQYGLIQVCETKGDGDTFFLFGMSLNIRLKKDHTIIYNAGDKVAFESMVNYLSLLTFQPEP